nr:gustatory receptor 23a [Nilaparvata lugens]
MLKNKRLQSNKRGIGRLLDMRNNKAATKRVTSLPHIIHVLDVNYKTAYDYHEKLRHCIYFEPIQIVLFVWSLLGRLPIRRDSTGDYIVPIVLRVYSFLVGSIIVVIGSISLRNLVKSLLNGESVYEEPTSVIGDYNYTLFWICQILVTTYNISLPFLDWTIVGEFLKFLRSWAQFQENYTLESRKVLSIKSKNRIRIIFYMTLLVNMTTVAYLNNFVMKNVDVFTKISTLTAVVELESRTAFFWHTCAVISDCSEQLSITFCKKTLESRVSRGAQTLGDYRRLWLQLTDITTSFSDLMSYKMTHSIFVNVIFVIVTSYHLALSALSRGVRGSAGDIYLYFFCSLYTAAHVMLACESGHRLAQSLGKKFVDRATRRRLQHLSFAERKEFSVFMGIVRRRSPSVILNGFLTVDRSLIVLFVSGCLTYLIILVQFKVGMSETHRVQNSNISLSR